MSCPILSAIPSVTPGEPSPPVAPPDAAKRRQTPSIFSRSAEPTDDSPTVISKAPQACWWLRGGHLGGAGLRGRQLAHFELIEPIGVGGMAAVICARDTQLDRLVALEDSAAGDGRRSRKHPPLSSGSPRRRPARSREHRARLFLRRRPGTALHRL